MRGGGERVGSMQSRGLPGGAAMYSSQPRAAQRSLTDTDPAPRNPQHGHTRREIIRKNGISDSFQYIFTILGVDWTLDSDNPVTRLSKGRGVLVNLTQVTAMDSDTGQKGFS